MFSENQRILILSKLRSRIGVSNLRFWIQCNPIQSDLAMAPIGITDYRVCNFFGNFQYSINLKITFAKTILMIQVKEFSGPFSSHFMGIRLSLFSIYFIIVYLSKISINLSRMPKQGNNIDNSPNLPVVNFRVMKFEKFDIWFW